MKKVLIMGAVVVLSMTALIGCGDVEELEEKEEFEEGMAVVQEL